NDTGVPANNSPQERPEDANSASAANTNRLRDVSPSVQISLQETSSLQATFEKLKASRSSESNLEIKREQGVTDFPPTATASQMASHPAVIGSSETASEVPLSELPGSELQLYTTPPYQTKITHR